MIEGSLVQQLAVLHSDGVSGRHTAKSTKDFMRSKYVLTSQYRKTSRNLVVVLLKSRALAYR